MTVFLAPSKDSASEAPRLERAVEEGIAEIGQGRSSAQPNEVR